MCFCVSTYIGNTVVEISGKKLSDVKECINHNEDDEIEDPRNRME